MLLLSFFFAELRIIDKRTKTSINMFVGLALTKWLLFLGTVAQGHNLNELDLSGGKISHIQFIIWNITLEKLN